MERTNLDFKPDNLNEIFAYWKRKWGKKRFEQKYADGGERIKTRFAMDIYKPGGFEGFFMPEMKTPDEFIEEYGSTN